MTSNDNKFIIINDTIYDIVMMLDRVKFMTLYKNKTITKLKTMIADITSLTRDNEQIFDTDNAIYDILMMLNNIKFMTLINIKAEIIIKVKIMTVVIKSMTKDNG